MKFKHNGIELKASKKTLLQLLIASLTGEQPDMPAVVPPLEWSPTLCGGKRVDYDEAEKAIKELGEGWRMPSRRELESIQNLTRHDPCIDIEKFPDTKSEPYWSGTPCAWNPSAVWIVHFGYGGSYGNLRYYYACVRAVRSSQ